MYCLELLESVKIGDISVAVQLTAYDDVYRAGIIDLPKLLPDAATIENIEIMVNRGVSFLKRFSGIKTDMIFEGGYTDIIVNGDCDYLTDNSLIDFKVLRGNVTKNHTLQILMYYLMGLHSIHSSEFQKVKWLTLFNPRKLEDIKREKKFSGKKLDVNTHRKKRIFFLGEKKFPKPT